MNPTASADTLNSPAGGSKNKKTKKKKGGGKGKSQGDSVKVNGVKTEDDYMNQGDDGGEEEIDTPLERPTTLHDALPSILEPVSPEGQTVVNGRSSTSSHAENSMLAGIETENTNDTNAASSLTIPLSLRTSQNLVMENLQDDTGARLEALAQERAALKDEVTQLRQSLQIIQKNHAEDLSTIRGDLEERTGEKEHAETQYRNLLGKVNTIRSQLGERLKADAEDLAQAKNRIEELEEKCDNLRGQDEARTAELLVMAEEGEQRSKELSSLRNRTTLSQQNWTKERDHLIAREATAREEFEAAKQAMQDWEIVAIEERSMRESIAERVSDLEEQLSSQRDAYERTASERDTQSLTVDGLQRALQEIQEARRKELRELVEHSQTQVGSLKGQLKEAQRRASEATTTMEQAKEELKHALPFEKEVKEKNLLIGKLRHEAVILNDHLTKALRYLKKGRPDDNIDKKLVTNHFLHFLTLERSDPKKFQILQIIAALLGWTDEQREQAGLARPGASNPNLRVPISPWHRTPSTPSLSTDCFPESSNRKESLAELWSDFLEQEAQEGGVKQVKRTDLHARFLFLSPPSIEVLEQRLRGRGTEDEESLKKRLDQAAKEMAFSNEKGVHDKIVVNDDVEKAFKEVEEWVVDGGKYGG
ncbi:MAG: hypothetical protein Q9182_006447 [Xanthomendoza sp. 2 TL-2023]